MARPRILITGATGAIGSALLRCVHAAGWEAIGVYRTDEAQAKSLRDAWGNAPSTLRLLRCDLANSNEVSALLAELGTDYCPDVLVHLAGPRLQVKPVQRAVWDEFQSQIDGVLKGFVLLAQPMVSRMLKRGSGRVIAALSAVVLGTPPRGFATYTTAKYALTGYLKCLAAECAGRGVSVNAISPGPINSAMLGDLPELMTEKMRESVPGGAWIDPDSVARAVYWFAAEAGPEITGCNLPLTSGMLV